MIHIICNSIECYIEDTVEANLLNKDIYKDIENKLSYVDKNKAFIKTANQDKRWSDNLETSVSLYNKKTRKFPAGLLDLCIKALKYWEIDYKVTDTTTYSLTRVSDEIVIPEWAYKHQLDMLKAALKGKKGIIEAAPSSGKSLTIAWLLSQFTNTKALIIVPRINLCNQLYKTLKENLPQFKVDKLSGEDKTFTDSTDILVAVVNSAAKLVENNPNVFNHINFLIADEGHRATTETFKTILYSCVNTEYKLGFSGTPSKSLLSKAYFGDVQIKIDEKRLIDNNIIVEPDYITYKIDKPNIRYSYIKQNNELLYVDDVGRPTFNNKPPYNSVYTECVAHNKSRNQTIVDISKYLLELPSRKGPIVVFIEWQDIHGSELVKLYKQNNIDITFLNGLTSNKERDKIIKNLRDNKLDIVLATNVVAEGTDIVNLEFAIIADGRKNGEHSAGVIQKVGRIIRKDVSNNKNRCIAIDIADTEAFYLHSAAKCRVAAFKTRYGNKKVYAVSNLEELNKILEL
jgi:superfamily II DNA or RNA helicase